MPRPSCLALGACVLGALVVAPRPAVAQAGGRFHPRWEIPGFDFHPDGVWRREARAVAANRARLLALGDMATLNAWAQGWFGVAPGAAPSSTATAFAGTIRMPALLFSYPGVDSALFMRNPSQYQDALFGTVAPAGLPYSLRSFYAELSNGLLDLPGQVVGWVRLANSEDSYTGTPGTCTGNPFGTADCNGLFSAAARASLQAGFAEALSKIDASVDFSQFDSNGDGFVDVIAFIHATRDGICGPPPGGSSNNHIWAHRFVLLTPYLTNDPNPGGGGNVQIRDYIVQSGLGGANACDSTQLMPIGTMAHEFGHGLGLPDLYDITNASEGIGEWGLMGSGNYSSPRSPTRMEAWSLNQLGWVTLRSLTGDGTYTFGAAPTADSAFLVRVQGSNPRGEYFLLENRQAVQADSAMIRVHCGRSSNPPGCGGGLLAWHVDSAKFAQGGALNGGSLHALHLMQADGRNELDNTGTPSNRGDGGDPYPGTTANTTLSFATNPAAIKNADGSFIGFALDSIRQLVVNGAMAFRLRFGGLTVVRASDTNAVVIVDGDTTRVFADLLADGTSHTVEVPDTQVAANGRTRWRFQSWSDGLLRSHTITGSAAGDTLIATLLRDFRLVVSTAGPGTVASTPTLNLAGELVVEGTSVALTATPAAGYVLGAWTGDTAATTASLTLPMGRPYTINARFDSTLVLVSAAARPGATMGAGYADTLRTSGGTVSRTWSVIAGTLPPGLTLAAATGVIAGIPTATGTANFTVRVTSGSQQVSQAYSITVTAPTLATADVVTRLLRGSGTLSADQLRYLDLLGNNNGVFDVGDFKAWVDATGAPLTAQAAGLVGRRP